MIVVSRKTGERLYADALTEEQQKAAALAVFRAFCQQNQEIIREAVEEYLHEND